MTIATQAAAISGMRPPVPFTKASITSVAAAPTSLYLLGGSPAAGTANTGLTGANFSSSSAVPAGIIYHQDPASGNAYLARLVASATTTGAVMLCDRLWDCGPVTASTSAQTITQPTLPARDLQGGTAGYGVQLAIEVVASTSATAAVISVSYTDPINGAGRTGAFVDLPTGVAASVGRFFRIGLQAGDVGVQSVQSVTFGTDWTSGTIALVAYRLLAVMDIQTPNLANQIDAVSAPLPQLFNGTCPFPVFLAATATTTVFVCGVYQETQG